MYLRAVRRGLRCEAVKKEPSHHLMGKALDFKILRHLHQLIESIKIIYLILSWQTSLNKNSTASSAFVNHLVPTVLRFQDLSVQVSPSSTCIADLILNYIIHLQIRWPYMAWHEKKQQSEGVWNFPVFRHLLVPIYYQMLPEKKMPDSLSMKRLRFYSATTSGKSIFLHPSRKNGVSQSYCFLTFSHPTKHLFTHFVTCTVCCDIRILTTGRMWGDLPTQLFSIHG